MSVRDLLCAADPTRLHQRRMPLRFASFPFPASGLTPSPRTLTRTREAYVWCHHGPPRAALGTTSIVADAPCA